MTIYQDNIPVLRSVNQQLVSSGFKTAKEIAGWMGALQAQDYRMSKWAFGIRLRNSTEVTIDQEIDSGAIIRTHLLRPTWHFVSADDIYWLLDLTAPRLTAASKSRDKQLGLTDSIIKRCNGILEKSLRDGNHKTREELKSELERFKINIDGNRASHIFMRAELEGIICSGRQNKGRPTYTILSEWVPQQRHKNREESLKELALRYFTSHGPATIHDFIWWSGLTIKDAKKALEFNKDYLLSEVIQNQTYWLTDTYKTPGAETDEIFFLPAFDEFLISYRDRSASLSLVDNKKAVSENGIFYPALLQNGQVIGTWKRSIKNNRVYLSKNLFGPVTQDLEEAIFKSSVRYSDFTGRSTAMI